MQETARYSEDASPRLGPIDELDREIERFDASLDRLTKILSPIMNQYSTANATLSEPRPEPATAFRGRLERLSDRLNRLATIMDEIDL